MSLFEREKIVELEQKMLGCGPRLTGSKAHKDFIELIKKELTDIGLKVRKDTLTMKKRWEPMKWELSIENDGEEKTIIPDATYYPYSGSTPPEGVCGKLIYCGKNNVGSFLGSYNKIAVVKMSVFEAGAGLIFKKRSVIPENYVPPKKLASPVVSSFVFPPMLKRAKLMGAKGVICIMTGCSDDNAAHQYLPFITGYKDCPALWVNESQGEMILKAEKKGATANLTLVANIEEKVSTETVFTVLEGRNTKETILINTHTDGTNAFEENGFIALLSLAKHFSSIPKENRKRTYVFSFVTGHFQLPQFGSAMNQATNRFLKKHKEFWNGKDGNAKAVAGISIEHLGCSEWRDSEDHKSFDKISDIDPELVFVANKKLNDIYIKATEGRKNIKIMTLRPKNLVYFGEGQPMYIAGIPTISLVPGPDYLCTNSPDGYVDKINYDLMEEQIETFKNCIELLDNMSEKEIGKSEIFTFGLGL